MKTFQINPAAKNIELRIRIGIDKLQTLGWDFDEFHQNTAEALGVSREAAEQHNLNNYIAEISLKGGVDNINTYYTWYSFSRNEYTGWESTGDDAQTIEDVIWLIQTTNHYHDYTTDVNGEYVPTFVEINNLENLKKEGYTHAVYYEGLEEGYAGFAKSYQEAVRIANKLNDLGNDSVYMPLYEAPYVEGSEYWGLPDTGGDSYIIMKL